MVVGVKKKAKPVKRAAKVKAPPRAKKPKPERTFVKASDYSKRKVGFPNMHITIAGEMLQHARRARAHRDAIRRHFVDLTRVTGDGIQADGGLQLQDAMVAALNYSAQIMADGAKCDVEVARALALLEQIGQFVDLKQASDGFFTRARREVAQLLRTKPLRKRAR